MNGKKQTRNKKVYFEMTSIFSSFHIMRALCDTIFSNKCSALPLYLIYLAMLVITVMEININVGWGAEQSKYHGTAAIEARSLPVMLPLSQTNKQWIFWRRQYFTSILYKSNSPGSKAELFMQSVSPEVECWRVLTTLSPLVHWVAREMILINNGAAMNIKCGCEGMI